MTKATKETIQYLSQLSRIGCPEEEQEAFLEDLNQILTYIEQLQELNTDEVLPCNHVIEGITNVTRDDVVGEVLPRKAFLDNCDDQISGLVRIPIVMKR